MECAYSCAGSSKKFLGVSYFHIAQPFTLVYSIIYRERKAPNPLKQEAKGNNKQKEIEMTREATTTYFNYSQIAGDNLQATDLDPFNNLELSDEQREEMNGEARNLIIATADKYLAPYGAEMVGNGDVYGPMQHASEIDREELREVLGFIDFDHIIEKYI